MRLKPLFLSTLLLGLTIPALGALSVSMVDLNTGRAVGTVSIQDTPYGALLTPKLQGLTPGPHGFHVHANPSCDQAGNAAGGHFDPGQTKQHRGPYQDDGHLGDLPVLIVDQQGQATIPVLAPRLKAADFIGHSLMVHAGGDNYSDAPQHLGGGGMRRVCGVIKPSSNPHE